MIVAAPKSRWPRNAHARPPNPFQPRGRAGAFGTGSNGVNTDGTTQPRQSERGPAFTPPERAWSGAMRSKSLAGHEVGLAWLSVRQNLGLGPRLPPTRSRLIWRARSDAALAGIDDFSLKPPQTETDHSGGPIVAKLKEQACRTASTNRTGKISQIRNRTVASPASPYAFGPF